MSLSIILGGEMVPLADNGTDAGKAREFASRQKFFDVLLDSKTVIHRPTNYAPPISLIENDPQQSSIEVPSWMQIIDVTHPNPKSNTPYFCPTFTGDQLVQVLRYYRCDNLLIERIDKTVKEEDVYWGTTDLQNVFYSESILAAIFQKSDGHYLIDYAASVMQDKGVSVPKISINQIKTVLEKSVSIAALSEILQLALYYDMGSWFSAWIDESITQQIRNLPLIASIMNTPTFQSFQEWKTNLNSSQIVEMIIANPNSYIGSTWFKRSDVLFWLLESLEYSSISNREKLIESFFFNTTHLKYFFETIQIEKELSTLGIVGFPNRDGGAGYYRNFLNEQSGPSSPKYWLSSLFSAGSAGSNLSENWRNWDSDSRISNFIHPLEFQVSFVNGKFSVPSPHSQNSAFPRPVLLDEQVEHKGKKYFVVWLPSPAAGFWIAKNLSSNISGKAKIRRSGKVVFESLFEENEDKPVDTEAVYLVEPDSEGNFTASFNMKYFGLAESNKLFKNYAVWNFLPYAKNSGWFFPFTSFAGIYPQLSTHLEPGEGINITYTGK